MEEINPSDWLDDGRRAALLFSAKPVTRSYPFERREAPERFRGKLIWDLTNCTGCQLCIKDCPANAIELLVVDKATKHFVMRFHADRCTYCSQCVVNCRFKCLAYLAEQKEQTRLNNNWQRIMAGLNDFC
jgi:formate hydrogenlyase subunit 6/NADH:ubiquinone oxidoreductase subunit I